MEAFLKELLFTSVPPALTVKVEVLGVVRGLFRVNTPVDVIVNVPVTQESRGVKVVVIGMTKFPGDCKLRDPVPEIAPLRVNTFWI